MRLSLRLALALALVVVCVSAFGQQQQQQMSPQEKAMMDAWMKFATPGDAHKALEPMIGTWDAKVTMWQAPGAPPQVSPATSEMHWMLGNRYVQETVTGTFMGMPFQGIGITGYDNAKKQYFNTWFDNFGTAYMTSVGTMSDPKTLTLKTSTTNPMNGKDMLGESKVTFADADHHMLEMWGAGPDGKTFKMMQIDYTRKK